MVAGISKRQQLRNERALQDLIRSVPGNDRCADCSAMNPGKIVSIADNLGFSLTAYFVFTGWTSWNVRIPTDSDPDFSEPGN